MTATVPVPAVRQFLAALSLSVAGAVVLLPESISAQSLSGREILERVEDNRRAVSDDAFNRLQLSSCAFGIQDGEISCSERPRTKSVESVSITTGKDNRDTRTVSIIREPASERGIGMLTYNYDDPEQDNETWLYLSALGQVKRIASSNSDEDSEPAAIFGSEFTTEDEDTGKLEEYDIRILGEDRVSNREVWRIETVPHAERARESRYARTVHYIDRQRFVTLRADMYDERDREIKRLMASRVEQVDGTWMARSLTMLNLVSNRLSNMAILEIHTGVDVPEDLLTPRTLTDVAFREAHLQELREQVD